MKEKEAFEHEKESVGVSLSNAWQIVSRKLDEWQDHEGNRSITGDEMVDTYEDGLITGTIYGLRMAMDLIGIEQKREDALYSEQLQKMEPEVTLMVGNLDV
jgi:hypothetical protein